MTIFKPKVYYQRRNFIAKNGPQPTDDPEKDGDISDHEGSESSSDEDKEKPKFGMITLVNSGLCKL